MNNYIEIDIGKDFSTSCGGRYRADSKHSGEEFRDDILIPAIKKAIAGEVVCVVVDLDNQIAFTGAFLEEVFGGLTRALGEEARRYLQIRAFRRPDRAEKAEYYMRRAE